MITPTLIFKEIRHRLMNFLLAVLAVVTAVTLYIGFYTASLAAERETARLMLSMGYNLRIIAADADMDRFLLTGVPDATMPQEYLQQLADAGHISYNHLMADLQQEIPLGDMTVLLTGLAPEVCPPGKKTPPITFQVAPGQAYIGHRIAQTLGINEGQTLDVRGTPLKVVRTLAESGAVDDIRLHCHIADAQAILNLPGRISQIQAVDCLCFETSADPVQVLRTEIGRILPRARVLQVKSIADARTRQRQMVRNLFAVIMPFIVLACGVWIAVLAVTNVRDRRQEIGILRALGYHSPTIATLFLGKAALTGLIGAALGFAAGTLLALRFGPGVFKITARTIITPQWPLLGWILIIAPLLAAVASFIPAMIAVAYDPAVTLREE
ncbi:MAG TPA: FtsX-like permease family protein [Phycisphaerales bacterium]|nr:FtsX-like permease family protein [Phycisphaerales bacterium]